MSTLRAALLALGALALLVLVASTASATHYRYGTLSWEPTENANEVLFTGGQAWRASAFSGVAPGAVIRGEGCINTGDGGCEAIYLKVNAVSSVNDYFSATFVDSAGNPGIRHTYPAPNDGGAPWVASFASCCRISPHSSGNFHVNNPDQSERLETLVDLAPPPNSAPRSALAPINPCPREALCTIPIPFVDAEGDTVTFRLATTSEAGDSAYKPPGAPHATHQAAIGADGVLTWDTAGATVSTDPNEHTLYSIQVMLEDGRTKTPLDFFIEIVPENVHPPRWVTPPTPCGQTITTGTGASVAFGIEAVSDDGRPVLLAHLGIPAGAALPIPPAANPATTTFSWTPASDQAGSYLVVLAAEDDRGYAAPPCAITIVVVAGPHAVAGPDVCVPFGSTITLDGSQSIYPLGTIVEYRWDFPHGATPLFGPVVTRTLDDPQDLAGPYVATLTITTNDSKTDTDTLTIHAWHELTVGAASDKPKYTPFQRPRGTASAELPCGGALGGAPMDLAVTFTTNDPTLDALLDLALGPAGRTWTTTTTLDAQGRTTWELPFTVAERFSLPLGLLNPVSAFLALQGDYVVEAYVSDSGLDGTGTARFRVVVDEQFPLDEAP